MKERDRISLIFPGRLPSKKNNREFRTTKYGGYTAPNQKHKDWHSEMMRLHSDAIRYLSPPYAIISKFYVDSFVRFDLSNWQESIHDWLSDVGIIDDDNAFVLPGYTPEFSGLSKTNPRVEVDVISMELTPADKAIHLLRDKDAMRSHVAALKASGQKASQASEERRLWAALESFEEYNAAA